jgi:hypothetical protein
VQVGKTGQRAFCIDASGRICHSSDGIAPPVQNGECPADCRVLY